MISARASRMFFDKAAVTQLLDARTRAALSKAGAFIRQSAKSSIRPRKAISNPGSPPSSHSGDLRRLIYFAYEPSSQSVVIGPVPFRAGEAPNLLEFGGRAQRQGKTGRRVIATYRSRPFMGPALEKEVPKLPSFWAGSVKG